MKYNNILYIFIGLSCFQFSCKNFLQIDPPKNSLVKKTVFQNNDQATAAITGIYATMIAGGYASGSISSITGLTTVSSDEMIGYHATNIPYFENQLFPELASLNSLYSGPYQSIFTANSVLEALENASGVTPVVIPQLQGEALFVRGFAYFYLVNLFGPVPLQLSTDYTIAQVASRASVATVYQQIIEDLKAAEKLLPEEYPTAGRVRPNRSAVQAMLARTYLYIQDWENAEKYASIVIAKKSTYNLVSYDSIFLANSQETIWQLMPQTNGAGEGPLFILQATPTFVALRNSFVLNGFEAADKRNDVWIKRYTNNTGTYHYPFKYKVRSAATVTEYSMILRLAEQYLIRAEARINQGKTNIGIEDLNIIRKRILADGNTANILPTLSLSLTKSDALLAVEQERKVELFSEWGHRWFDLKRTGRAAAILGEIKSQWQETDLLYPIPANEISRNRNIIQNKGY